VLEPEKPPSINHAHARNKPQAPGHRLPAGRTKGAPLIVGMPLACRVGDLVRLGVPMMGFIMVETLTGC
jgi:hypothetical protein